MKNYHLKAVTGFAIFALIVASLFAFRPTKQAQAQSFGSAITSGLAQGLGGCAAQVGGSVLSSVIGGSAASLLNVTSVPVSDGGNLTFSAALEGCLDGIAYATAKNILNNLADSTLTWVQSGFTEFGQPGNQAYIGDLNSFAANVGDQTFNEFAQEFNSEDGDEICDAFSQEVKRNIVDSYYESNDDPTGIPPNTDDFINNSSSNDCEEFLDIMAENGSGDGSVEDFLSGDFEAGGWAALDYTINNPNASPVSSYIAQNNELKDRITQARELNIEELAQSNGWLSAVQCAEGSVDPATNKCPNGDEPLVETPGPVVNQAINDLVGSGGRQLELADEVNEIVSALAGQLVANLAGSGSSNNGGFFDENLADRTSSLGDLTEYAEGGYQGGFQADYASSTLVRQIEREQNILSYINGGNITRDGTVEEVVAGQGLPTTAQLSELRARANQCVANDVIGGPGDINEFQEKITRLSSAEQSVFSGLNRETQTAQQNPFGEQGNTGGPQKVDWAGNPLDWESGNIYGVKNCREFANAYKLSYVPETTSGNWRAFVCKTEDSGDFNETSTQFNGSFVEISESSIASLYGESRKLYKVPNEQQVKVDWTGADFDWDYYDRFAGEFARSLHEAVANPIFLGFGSGGGVSNGTIIVNGTLDTYSVPGATPSAANDELEKVGQILSGVTSEGVNRYGLQVCNDGTINVEGFSYVVKPGEDQWTEQECIETSQGFYRFQNTGETPSAFRDKETAGNIFADYDVRIRALIGDQQYDEGESGFERFTPPTTEEDNLRELLNDINTLQEDAGSVENISEVREALDTRFGRLESRFHTDEHVATIAGAYSASLNPSNPESLYNQIRQVVNSNNSNGSNGCPLPDDYEAPEGTGGGGFDGGDGDDSGDDDGGGDGGGATNVSTFSARRVGSGGLISINWETNNADSCVAISSPYSARWNGEVTSNGARTLGSQGQITLTLRCQGNGVDQASQQIPASSRGGGGGGREIQVQ